MARAKWAIEERSRRWSELVLKWRDSGASQAVFCREHGVNANSFNFWKLRVLRQRPGARRKRRMLMLSRSVRIFIGPEATDMRRSLYRLAEMTRRVIGQDPLAGHFFVFFNRPRDRVKILVWERGGFAIWYKRLEEGFFKLPSVKDGVIELEAAELTLILEGIELAGAQKQPRYIPRKL